MITNYFVEEQLNEYLLKKKICFLNVQQNKCIIRRLLDPRET